MVQSQETNAYINCLNLLLRLHNPLIMAPVLKGGFKWQPQSKARSSEKVSIGLVVRSAPMSLRICNQIGHSGS